MYPVLIACQVKLSLATRVSVGVCLFNVVRQLFKRNYFALFVDLTEALLASFCFRLLYTETEEQRWYYNLPNGSGMQLKAKWIDR